MSDAERKVAEALAERWGEPQENFESDAALVLDALADPTSAMIEAGSEAAATAWDDFTPSVPMSDATANTIAESVLRAILRAETRQEQS